ncbi:MAG: peptidoglycan bridge formation glycyltransferase FemA/FemB family protein [Candidatus Absconditabacterales bacterium]
MKLYNFYQSQIRKDIQQIVYAKPTFQINLFGKDYFGIVKPKKIGPFTLNRYQVMGVEIPKDQFYVRKEIKRIKKEFGTSKLNVFFQLGLVNEMISFDNVSHRSDSFKDDMKQMRLNLREYICKNFNLENSFRENMPQSDILIDLNKTDDELIQEMNSGCKDRIKKAVKKGIEFGIASPDQYKLFYDKWVETSSSKGFNIIPYSQYEKLIRYITQNFCGNLFITNIGGELVSGSICLYDKRHIIYLYGFTNRKFGNVGSHHYLKYKMFSWARDNGFLYCDLMGGAPTGFDDHPLVSVSNFKESLGGIKVEQYGNYDMILNKFLYKIFRRYYKLRK